MIKLTKLNGKEFIINIDSIEFAEATPDSVISTVSGKKVVVKESIDEIIEKVIECKKKIRFCDNIQK